ncbi:MAG: YafY family transcriptional regulator [Actinobacteria bacterium]|nr:YafY family transcriptional regulator [Actinomycetota bacterium]
MRADRLVSVLLLLQQRQQVTAAEVAAELEISPRTARRDLEALGMAGLPVYSLSGRHGGWRLAGGGRTDLSGLSQAEAQALFMVAGPQSSTTPEVKAALRKLVRALPEPFRVAAERAGTTTVIDQRRWGQRSVTRRDPTLLDDVREAVVQGWQLELDYTARTGESTTRTVEPLGLAAKAGTWYLVADTAAGLRTFRVDRIGGVRPTGRPSTVPPGFDLTQAWSLIADRVEDLRTPVVATARVHRDALRMLAFQLGERLRVGAADGEWVDIEVRGHHVRELANELCGYGASMDVLEPAELRIELRRLGEALVNRYGS